MLDANKYLNFVGHVKEVTFFLNVKKNFGFYVEVDVI